ncbi:MAG: radical SAM protein [Clostridia bacterium]|nr:radical SAM protein [Clostridia bacterium]
MQKTQTEPYLSRFLHSKGAKLGLPIGGNFELTARCNFRCPMCYIHKAGCDHDKRQRELSTEQWIGIARAARDRGMVFALLTGGEPFLREDFFDIYSAMKKMGIMVSINSNGSLLDGEIRRRLLEDPPFRINISLYGGCEETYSEMCGSPSFARVVENIRALKEGGIDVRLNLSITPYNCRDLDKIYRVAEELQVHVKATAYMYPPIRLDGEDADGTSRLCPEEAAKYAVYWDTLRFTRKQFLARAEHMRNLCGVDCGSECSAEMEEGVSCRAGSSAFWLTWDGLMLPCGMMPHPIAYPLHDGFDAAWDQILAETKALRLPNACTVCPKREVCAVCAAVCVSETGHFDWVPEFVCASTDAILAETAKAAERLKSEELL